MLKRVVAYIAAGAVVIAATLFVVYLAEEVNRPSSTFDIRPALLLASLVAFNSLTYLVWWSRWNIVAHTSLAFSVVAYVIPIVVLGDLNEISSQALDLYYQVMALGLLFGVLGVFAGFYASKSYNAERMRERASFDDPEVQTKIRRRVLAIGLLCVLGVVVAFAGMRFIPALTADPLTAKFFRGAYAAAYQPVAPLYRGATSVLAVLLPVIFLYAMKLRSFRAFGVAGSAVLVLLLGLMREPAVSGVLLLLGVYIAVRKLPWLLYFAILVASYFLGGSLYYLLSLIGFGSFGDTASAQMNLIQQAAAGAPDIRDQITFLSAWLQRPSYTYGLTWIGGLLPGNNPWNTSVWSLQVVNPGQDITSIASGGLRLPPPIWGMVSFGWFGVVLVSFLTGAVQGFLAGVAQRVIPSPSIETSTYWLVIYVALADVLPNFFRLSYLTIIQLGIVILLFRWRTKTKPPRVRPQRNVIGVNARI